MYGTQAKHRIYNHHDYNQPSSHIMIATAYLILDSSVSTLELGVRLIA